MVLTPSELEFYEISGTELLPIDSKNETRPKSFRQAIGAIATKLCLKRDVHAMPYELLSDCGYLQNIHGESSCSISDTPAYPKKCQKFIPGSYRCRLIRMRGEIDSIEEWQEWEVITRSRKP